MCFPAIPWVIPRIDAFRVVTNAVGVNYRAQLPGSCHTETIRGAFAEPALGISTIPGRRWRW